MLTQAMPADEAALVALFDAGFADYASGLGRESLSRVSWVRGAIAAGGAFWVSGTQVAAIVERDGTTLKLDALVVHPDAQRAGLGRAGLSAIEDHARSTGATEVALLTAQAFTHLVAFYSSAGYRVLSVGPHPKGRDDRLRVFLVKSLV
ncbi:MAG: GNAT family N-acetyltransferase [Pseudomonadota bacterium]